MNVLIIGGAGFIGYHAVRELLRRGHAVSILSRSKPPAADFLPPEAQLILANLDEMPDAEARDLLRGYDGLVFAAGADDRVTPPAPAYPYFYKANVAAAARVFTLARQAGVRRGVLLGSYFAYFDRIWPEERLSEHHPYVRSRREQEEAALAAARPDLDLMILELPYIFGAAPGRRPLWAPIIAYVRASFLLFYPDGGTNMVAVQHVAEAIAGALERGQAGERYVVGEENLTWAEWLERLSAILGRKKRVITAPTWMVRIGMRLVQLWHRLHGKEGGLEMVAFTRLQTAKTFFDPTPSRLALGYGQGGLSQALVDTVRGSLVSRPLARK
jgi:nucleoside-diphosphate-sugar epimerase